MTPACEVILASASQSRRRLLKAAGVAFRVVAANVDEAAIKRQHVSGSAGFDDLAAQLATQKALAIANRYPGALVIGADQLLVIDGRILDKPGSREIAYRQLLSLRGKTHSLVTAVTCVRSNEAKWLHVDTASLTMREFSPEFLEAYLSVEGSTVTETVGGYRLEGYGIQLFKTVVGDYFAILGLPLLPLLNFLRAQGAVDA